MSDCNKPRNEYGIQEVLNLKVRTEEGIVDRVASIIKQLGEILESKRCDGIKAIHVNGYRIYDGIPESFRKGYYLLMATEILSKLDEQKYEKATSTPANN